MTNFKTLLVSALICGVSACSGGTDTAPALDAPVFDTAAMDALLSGAVDRGDVIGVQALVFDEGRTVYKNQFGLADRERETPVADDTVYRVYSMTKPLTSALIMDLMEEGKLKLSDPASKYIPELAQMKIVSLGADGTPQYAGQARPMTVEDLLLHRAGMAYGIFGGNPIEDAWAQADLFNTDMTTAETMKKLPALPLLGQPGEQWFYSYSIDVLGRIAEVVTGQTLGEAMKARVFDPLGMTETAFRVSAELKPRFASNYALQPDGSFVLFEDGQTSPFTQDGQMESGGGGLTSTTEDWLKFARLSTPELEGSKGRYPGQFGWGGAARTNFWVDPENGSIGIIMLQFFSPSDPKLHDDFQALTLAQTRDDD